MKPDPYDDKYLTFRLLLSDLTSWIEQAKREGEDIQPMLDWSHDALSAIQKDMPRDARCV